MLAGVNIWLPETQKSSYLQTNVLIFEFMLYKGSVVLLHPYYVHLKCLVPDVNMFDIKSLEQKCKFL